MYRIGRSLSIPNPSPLALLRKTFIKLKHPAYKASTTHYSVKNINDVAEYDFCKVAKIRPFLVPSPEPTSPSPSELDHLSEFDELTYFEGNQQQPSLCGTLVTKEPLPNTCDEVVAFDTAPHIETDSMRLTCACRLPRDYLGQCLRYPSVDGSLMGYVGSCPIRDVSSRARGLSRPWTMGRILGVCAASDA